MSQQNEQFDFLNQYIEQLLDQHGFDTLSEESRAQYIPQFVAEAQRRIGLALIDKIDEPAAKQLQGLLEDENISPEKLQQFWQTNVPEFDAIVKQTLDDFAQEFASVMS
ncbi:hypothetical protein KKG22_02080 [Patescibacteria group bacterium]|nr:hypothetical protein [Patescibacteria group bacterium]MBU1721859.1 hypothetical protein [Patescibacteria group bacterium]MBU1901317.1 hypothetical protein [Patescibacteria group bacterium]